MTRDLTFWVAIGVLLFMMVMVIAALYNMQTGGSLDNLPGDLIKKAVGESEE